MLIVGHDGQLGKVSYPFQVIQRGMKYGEFKQVNERMIAMSIMTSLHGMIWFVLFKPKDFSLEEYVDLNMELILKGIAAE